MTDAPTWIDKLTGLAPRFTFAGAALAFFLLLSPEGWLRTLGLESLAQVYRPWIGGVALLSSSLWLTNLVPWMRRRLRLRKARKLAVEDLWSMSPEERLLLGYFVWLGSRTAYVGIHDPAAMSLCSKGILKRVGTSGNRFRWPHIVPRHIWSEIDGSRKVLFPDIDDPEVQRLFEGIHAKQQRYAIGEVGA